MKKTILAILDGWGHGAIPEVSAITQANTPFVDSLYKNYPNAELVTYGEQVGLPEGQMGNSEVGHLNIGAGRVVYQELARINKEVRENTLGDNETIQASMDYAKANGKDFHLMGLVSNGGVHAHINHLKAFLAGQVGEKELNTLNETLISKLTKGNSTHPIMEVQPFEKKKIHIHKPKAQQTAIRIGRGIFSKHHEDYAGLYVLNTILGGYFGSRLMANIREDKGYTYNVYSMLDGMRHDGSWIIGTEVGNDVVDDTIKQIYLEMERLQKETMPNEELEMVKNYLLGTLLNTIDGPFNVSEVHRTIAVENLPEDFFVQIVETVKRIDAKTVQSLANKYLKKSDFYEVVVGAVE